MNATGIDIFCHVIDNFGDAGVVYRFAKELKHVLPACTIRVFIDDLKTLSSIVPSIQPSKSIQEFNSITYIDTSILNSETISQLGTAEVLVEAFACEIPEPVLDVALFKSKLIINLDYLSAEEWVEGYHLKQSLLNRGTAKKFFFMPGFNKSTGGVILNSKELQHRIKHPATRIEQLNSILKTCSCDQINDTDGKLFGTVFSYERGFDNLLNDLAQIDRQVYLIVLGQKSHNSIKASLKRATIETEKHCVIYKNMHICFSPLLCQEQYDSLLYCTDFNLVRGEDSLVRAVCSGKPFVWNAYLQENCYQTVKVDAFLENFRQYFDDLEVFNRYKELMIAYNNALDEKSVQATGENFHYFFNDLNKIEHAAAKMSYFIENNCNLVQNFCDFLSEFNIA